MPLPPDIKHVHFVGIGGYGMSALALILLEKGFTVSGSDIKESALTVALKNKGAAVSIGHRAENLGAAGLVVYSTAIHRDNPELLETARRGLPLWHRSELLAVLLNKDRGIAVAGAHGKTTTTAMVALLLEAGGFDPTAIIGGVLPAFGGNARLGQSSYLVAEADESDRSFTRYFPRLALVTGMEADHLEHYENDYSRLLQAYEQFLNNLSSDGTAVLCFDDPGLVELASRLNCAVVSYAAAPDRHLEPDYYPQNINLSGTAATFDLYCRGRLLTEAVRLGVPGHHNVTNAVGALALAHRLDIEPAACAGALNKFSGVGRRFEIIGSTGGVTVVDDYAHHPTEIKATLEAARLNGRRIICVFQPHRYSRTAAFFEQFTAAFGDADHLLLHSVYPAGETPLPGISAEILSDSIRRRGDTAVFYSPEMSELEEKAITLARPGDLIITMGAGDITGAAPRILEMLRNKEKS